MSTQVKIDHARVNIQVSKLRKNLMAAKTEQDTKYGKIKTRLNGLDSATNAELMDVVELNKRKNEITMEAIDKLLLFMMKSSQQFESLDREMGTSIQSIQISTQAN